MRIISIIISMVIALNTNGQPGFSKNYDFGSEAYFHNVLLQNDTLVVAGARWDAELGKVAPILVFMDTSGIILSSTSYVDTLSHLAFQAGYPLIKASNNHFLMMGDAIDKQADFLLEWDEHGGFVSIHEYPYPDDVLTSFPHGLVEVQGGYLVFYTIQLSNFKLAPKVTKINVQGEIQWAQSYGIFNLNETVGSIYKVDENTFVVGSKRGTNIEPIPNGINCSQTWIFAIDSLGEKLWEWLGEPCEGSTAYGLQPAQDGGWIYASANLQIYDQNNWGHAPKFVRLDADFNILWERQVGETYWDGGNHIIGLAPTPDGNYLGVGRWIVPEPYYTNEAPEPSYTAGCHYKVSADGDSIWRRCDTIVGLPNTTWDHELNTLVMLPSGSSIAVGSFDENLPGASGKSWAWAVKLDGNGCLAEGDCAVTGVEEEVLEEKEVGLSVYPNPARGQVTLALNLPLQHPAEWVLSDGLGRSVFKGEMATGQAEHLFQLPEMPPGLYFWEMTGERASSGTLQSGKLVITK